MIQSIVNFVFLISSRTNRENLAQKLRLPYSDGFGVKKNLFSYALQTTLALNTKKNCLPIYLGSSRKKTLVQQVKKALKTQTVLWSYPAFFCTFCFETRNSERKRERTSGPVFYLPKGWVSPNRNLWFPVCWENLYLKVNLFLANALVGVCFFKEKY